MRLKQGWLLIGLLVACRNESPPQGPVVEPVAVPLGQAARPAAVTEAQPVAEDPPAAPVAARFATGEGEKVDPAPIAERENDQAPSEAKAERQAEPAEAAAHAPASKPASESMRAASGAAPKKASMPSQKARDFASDEEGIVGARDLGGLLAPSATPPVLADHGALEDGPANNALPYVPYQDPGGTFVPLPRPRTKVIHQGIPYRPLPPMVNAWPRDARYRSNYLPGRGYLEHLRTSLQSASHRLGAGADATLAQNAAPHPSWPAPKGRALALAVDQVHGVLPPSGGETTLRVRVRAADAAPKARAPLRLHFAVDTSGSMVGAPWRSVCAAIRDVATRLTDADRLSVSTYASHGRIFSAPVAGGAEAAGVAERICASRPTGNTNVYEGLMTAYQQARDAYDPRAINRVIVVSDGIATAGPRDLHTLTVGTVEALGYGVTTSVVGVGDEFDALLMGRVAAEGAGNYHFARDHHAVSAVFSDELAVLAQEAAQAAEVRIELAADVALLEVVGSEPLGVVEAMRVRQVEIASDKRLAEDRGIAADRTRDRQEGVRFLLPSFRLGDEHAFFVRIRVPARGSGPARPLAKVSLRYKDMLFDRNQHLVADRVGWYADSDDAAEVSRLTDVELGEARGRVAYALERASQYLHPRNVSALRREMYSAASRLTGAADRSGVAAIAEEARRIQQLADLAGTVQAPKDMGVLAAVYHYGWRTCGLD